eukprot:gnl/TRDRNA2_/TRDRNA2_192506_c0_seq1.p1 gnl/TRDRNA2_/TRDRNA2_192506_c0~~gnl/TRDRNA2_/TRDRNA2_192506_c0_seq1.p1  ORF type:complete len:226 (+),score=40.99 gnl/TRDRNA2_/TRDRNA2_192506_c0_seq1:51-728(+)
MGLACSNDGEGERPVALVDDEEILFVGRRAARDEQVTFLPGELSHREGGLDPSAGSVAAPQSVRATDKRQAKAAIARLVQSLVKGRGISVSSAGGGTRWCTAQLDKDLTQLTLKGGRKGDQVIPLESVVEVADDSAPGAARYSFGKCAVRLRLDSRKEVLVMQLDSREECETFITCIRACAKHQRKIMSEQNREVQTEIGSVLSVPSTILRTVGDLKGQEGPVRS